MNFESVEKIAAAILYEGYILYPYRSTAIKNRQRWNFGTLYPRAYAQQQCPAEAFRFITECLVVPDAHTSLDVKFNFLQLVGQQQSRPSQDLHGLRDPSLDWQEAIERTSEHHDVRLSDLTASPLMLRLQFGGADFAADPGKDSSAVLQASVKIGAEMLSDGACKLHLELANVSPLFNDERTRRDQALLQSFVSAHVLLGISGGVFVSQLDPEERYRESSGACRNTGVFPVLVGEEPERTRMLCAPIILYDYPKIAPESSGDFFDGTEMDEMLALRVLTLTDAEKQEMRAGDARARAILERTEALTAESQLKAHGVIRGLREIWRGDTMNGEWNPLEETRTAPESVRVFGTELRVGNRVRLWPQKTADIMDIALTGKVAVIEAIEQDFEDQVQLAVVLDDDPGREFGLMRQPGHRFFFSPEEVEPIEDGAAA